MYKFELNCLSLTCLEMFLSLLSSSQTHHGEFVLSLTKINIQLNTAPRAHVQLQTQWFEFDLRLTKIQPSTEKPKLQERMYKVKLKVFEFDLND